MQCICVRFYPHKTRKPMAALNHHRFFFLPNTKSEAGQALPIHNRVSLRGALAPL